MDRPDPARTALVLVHMAEVPRLHALARRLGVLPTPAWEREPGNSVG